MSGVAVLARQRAHATRHYSGRRFTKAEHAETMRRTAATLLAYADEHPDARQSALDCLDRADALEQHPRSGWYPRRPRRWRP